MKTIIHKKGVIEACRPESEECQELQRSYDRLLDLVYLEDQSWLSRPELQDSLENNLSRVEQPWPEIGDGGEIVPVRESDNERKSDAQVNKILLTAPILIENLSVLTCHKNWRTTEMSLVEKKILTVLEQFFT